MSEHEPDTAVLPRPPVGESRLLRQGSVTTEYFVHGAGETVVLVPAFGRSVSDFNELAVALNEAGYRTVGIQPRGVGKSTSPVFPRATMHDFARDVADVIRALPEVVGGKIHAIGRAFGARVVRTLASDSPELVQSVVLLGGGAEISGKGSKLARYILSNFRFIPQRWRDRAQAQTLYAPGNPIAQHLTYRHPFRAVRRQFAALRTPMNEVWRPGTVPILWIHGQQDVLVPVSYAETMRDRFPDQLRLVVIANAAHALLPEQPEAVLQAVLAFFRQHVINRSHPSAPSLHAEPLPPTSLR